MIAMPCFHCLFMTDLKARGCYPRGDCAELEVWLTDYLSLMQSVEVICIFCGSFRTVRCGFSIRQDGSIRSRYFKCNDCHRKFGKGAD